MKKSIVILLLIMLFSYKVNAETLTDIYEIKPTHLCTINTDPANNLRVMQGVYFYDHYAVYAGYQADDKPTIITLVDLNTCKVVTKNNEKVMGHANDLTYNSKENKYYVTTGLDDNLIYGFKISNNKIVHDKSPIKMKFRTAGFDYDKDNDKYYSYAGGKLYSFKAINTTSTLTNLGTSPIYYSNFENGETKLVTQSLSYQNNNIYFARTISNNESANYNDSYVLIFNAKTGKYKYSLHFPASYFSGHLEGVSAIGSKIYFGINVHTKPQHITFMVYDGIDKIENKYNSIIKKTELIKTVDNITIFEKEEFDYSKIKIRVTYNDDSKKDIVLTKNNCTLSNFNNTKIGKQTVTIKHNNNNYKVDITIKKIEESSRELLVTKSIEINKGSKFDFTNVYLLVKYNNNTQKQIKLNESNTKVTNFNSTKTGKQTVTLIYDNKEYKIEVNVKNTNSETIVENKIENNVTIDNKKEIKNTSKDKKEKEETKTIENVVTKPDNETIINEEESDEKVEDFMYDLEKVKYFITHNIDVVIIIVVILGFVLIAANSRKTK